MNNVRELATMLLLMLRRTEESDDGRVFHPNTISSCRADDMEVIRDILTNLEKELL